MLILTRRVGETLTIGNSITLTVIEVKDESVRIDISAPRDILVHCEKIHIRDMGPNERNGAPEKDE